MTTQTATRTVTPQQYEATARWHDRMADLFARIGRTSDARVAREMAAKCREMAQSER